MCVGYELTSVVAPGAPWLQTKRSQLI